MGDALGGVAGPLTICSYDHGRNNYDETRNIFSWFTLTSSFMRKIHEEGDIISTVAIDIDNGNFRFYCSERMLS